MDDNELYQAYLSAQPEGDSSLIGWGCTNVAAEVVRELKAMKNIGIKVTKKQLDYPAAHPREMMGYRKSMTISEIADLVRELA